MKIKIKNVSLEYALARPIPKRKKLKRPSFLFRTLIRLLSIGDLKATNFSYTRSRLEQAGDGPFLILMNHSSFIDLKIASKILYPKPYYIVTTTDGFVGKSWLMRQIGCIPTQKYVADIALTRDMIRAVKEKNVSVLMFPEAGYSFDGRTTTLPRKLGMLLKKMNVPVLTIITNGAFLRQPLYNDLKLRKCKVTAHVDCLFTAQEIAEKSVDELDEGIDKAFAFDAFKTQAETNTVISHPERAQGLHRVLYRCPKCGSEGTMVGEGTSLSCSHCGKRYEMDEHGKLRAVDGETEFSHIPDWFDWQRDCVKKELLDGSYRLDTEVDIILLRDYKALYRVGTGRLIHDKDGFRLSGCDGKIDYVQKPLSSYGLNSDFNWYEIGDVICIGDKNCLYYCFPKTKNIVTKARFAAEELFKLLKAGAPVKA